MWVITPVKSLILWIELILQDIIQCLSEVIITFKTRGYIIKATWDHTYMESLCHKHITDYLSKKRLCMGKRRYKTCISVWFSLGVPDVRALSRVCWVIPVAVESSQHHVCGVKRVDEVWREGILLFNCVWPPEKRHKAKKRDIKNTLSVLCCFPIQNRMFQPAEVASLWFPRGDR